MPSVDDLRAAKQVLSARLLRAGRRGEVIGMRAAVRVSEAVAAAPTNVHAVGIGKKVVEGAATGQPCIRVYVVQKIAPSLLPPIYRIPTELDGIPTDIVESAPAFITKKKKVAAASAAACSTNRRQRQRPVVAGISAAHFNVTAGTIAYFCRSTRHGDDPAAVHLFSNNHVFADVNQAAVGDAIYQAAPADGGTATDAIAEVVRWVHIHLGGVTPNRVDAALAKMNAGVSHTTEICTIGAVSGVERAEEDDLVRKHGRTSGYTEGVVTDAAYDALVGMDHNDPTVVALFQNQLRIERVSPYLHFGLGGDSGSLVVRKTSQKAVGLYFAGPESGVYGVANRLDDVLAELEIELH
jgi:hypothetical protein